MLNTQIMNRDAPRTSNKHRIQADARHLELVLKR
jgi:hypothetical protein